MTATIKGLKAQFTELTSEKASSDTIYQLALKNRFYRVFLSDCAGNNLNARKKDFWQLLVNRLQEKEQVNKAIETIKVTEVSHRINNTMGFLLAES